MPVRLAMVPGIGQENWWQKTWRKTKYSMLSFLILYWWNWPSGVLGLSEQEEDLEHEYSPTVEEAQVWEHLNKLGITPQVLGELANVIVRHSELSLKDCGDQEFPWKKANVTVIFRKARKDLGKYRLVSLTCEGDGANPPGKDFPTS